MFDLLKLMAHKQCCVIITLNKRRYTSDIGVFDMFTIILANTLDFFENMTPLVRAVLSMRCGDILPLGDYCPLQLFSPC